MNLTKIVTAKLTKDELTYGENEAKIRLGRLWRGLNKAFVAIEERNRAVETIYMGEEDYETFKKYIGSSFDPCYMRHQLEAGYMGNLWCAQVMVDKKMKGTKFKAS
jgi:hypothetical protein